MTEQNEGSRRDKIRGCMIGGAAGDALGFAVEFWGESMIFSRYGERGIRKYEPDRASGKALISDDTQMALFTANGLLAGGTRSAVKGVRGRPRDSAAMAYQDWLRTQEYSYDEGRYRHPGICWLLDVPELFDRRAPGNTCLSALTERRDTQFTEEDYIRHPLNEQKGCGGVMRIAPMGLIAYGGDMKQLDMEGAQIAAVTHGNSLGYMPAAVVTHIIHSLVYGETERPLKEIIAEARDTTAEIFSEEAQLPVMTEIINRAMELAENGEEDLENIHRLGEGWVAEETLGIALYCALRHEDDFSAGLIAAVNHRGDSDSTGAVTGNILGALHGFDAIGEKWKQDLELYDVILEMADDLCDAGRMAERGYRDPVWTRKYLDARRKE